MRYATPLSPSGYGGRGPSPSLGTLNVATATQSGPRLGADAVTSALALVGARNATRCTSSAAF